MAAWFRLLAAPVGMLCAMAAGSAAASQFYIFPVKEIEGLSTRAAAEVRPLVDREVVALFPAASQRALLDHFVAETAQAYPDSVVHARQIGGVMKGVYQFSGNDNPVCSEGFTAPIAASYALVIGVTRASYYEVDRGSNIELLIPVTLNLQVIKPDHAKVAYTISETVYSPFLFTKEEYRSAQAHATIVRILADNTKKQIGALLATAKRHFNPQQTVVKLVGRDGRFFVADKGFEIGFQPGQELDATTRTGKQAVFRVISVDSGYAVLRPLEGKVSTDEEYLFTFETPVDDTRKPRLMPVTSTRPEARWSNAVADLFAKDIGFKAPFQMAPVDVNFSDTMNSVRAQANCVPWDKFPSAKTVSGSRVDAPNFFLRFEHARSPVAFNAGRGSVKTTESFLTVVSAQVVDNDGNVVSSEIGSAPYSLEKVAGQGLNLPNAQEVALKNATANLAANFLKSVRLTPVEFRIQRADQHNFWVAGLPLNGQVVSYEVLRPLSVNANGKPALMRLALDASANPPEVDGDAARFAYAISAEDVPAPVAGDIVRVLTMARGRLPEMSACGDIYRAADSLAADFLAPLINHVAYGSPRYLVSIANPDFYADANRLLDAGFYKFRLPAFMPTEFCFKPGYKVMPTAGKCEDACSSTFLNAATVIVEKSGVRVHEAVQAQQITIDGFAEPQRNNVIGLKSMEEVLRTLNDLSRKFQSK